MVTVLIWTSFILIARASNDPARGGLLTPYDIAYCRVLGASLMKLFMQSGWVREREESRALLVTEAGMLRIRSIASQ